ncbi:hypothetical protein PSECIP111951_02607 [Pseudoalteromonas holothuriae]|uniref:DUF403 domain-containing protein n=1 Tax=Pseudoalteromonas holothuriae TaxID=2963714 RepID=A0A9W4VVJ7_9GAMM|nr:MULTISPECIES: alpha-E domain-containing protein [unclassified Pseudoalteromonas]CAH9062018.1 hypothetical protein PSECIP111951_02607 [Pseudoalteromonas sp. CIP111951]CAH9065861.1 hypothetical protein PSECIP111854_03768 [Pseudoalteromonas sp. CIP111854]
MLSRVANSIYWMIRYLERAENTARVINVNSHLLLDLPDSVELGWEPIIDILSSRDLFYEKYQQANEENVIQFMLVDQKNMGSIVSSLIFARENARTVKEIIPREAWEQINNLYLDVVTNQAEGFSRRTRYSFLARIILANQTIVGLLAGTMSHDEAYDFMKIGRNLERADMSTRLIDVRSASLLENVDEELTSFKNIQWMSVLKSMTAYQMYRRQVRMRVTREDVLNFLLLDKRFPRSLLHTFDQIEHAVSLLPNNTVCLEEIGNAKTYLISINPSTLLQDKLHDFIDVVQLNLSEIDNKVAQTYF